MLANFKEDGGLTPTAAAASLPQHLRVAAAAGISNRPSHQFLLFSIY
jgi:hypothetical protein